MTESRTPARMTPALTLLLAVAGGTAVGNLYWAQPLLASIARSLDVAPASAGSLVTVSQLGYALGILLIVPLGDMLDRRRLVPAAMLACAAALAACALAPSFTLLLVAMAAVGVTTIGGQLIAPLAGDLAPPEQRGRIVATVVFGLLTGVLLSRPIAGVVADRFGWRAIFVVAAVLTLSAALLLARFIPNDNARPRIAYGTLIRSVFATVRDHATVRVILTIGSSTFAIFAMFWTGMTFLLSAPPYSFSAGQIGLASLVNAVGVVAAQRSGLLYDRGLSVPAKGVGLALLPVGLALAALGTSSIYLLLAGAMLIGLAVQMVSVLNQTRIFEVNPASRSRLNTAYLVGNFAGGAVGAALAGVLWRSGGWLAVTGGEAVFAAVALAAWFIGLRALARPAAAG